MNKLYLVSILMLWTFSFSLFASESDTELSCTVVSEDIEKIVCKVQVDRADYDRDVTFFWHAKRYPQDDRERTVVLNANHGSVYDYRFLRGRVQGEWSVMAIIDEQKVEVSFVLESNTLEY